MKGTFTSVWSDGGVITTPATLDKKTGEVVAIASSINNKSNLVSEHFTDKDGNDYDICPDCHEYIMKTVMVDGIGKCLEEKRVCSNFECAEENSY